MLRARLVLTKERAHYYDDCYDYERATTHVVRGVLLVCWWRLLVLAAARLPENAASHHGEEERGSDEAHQRVVVGVRRGAQWWRAGDGAVVYC